MDLGSLVAICTGGVGAVVGVLGTALKYGKKIKAGRAAIREGREAWIAIQDVIAEHKKANADNVITPEEVQKIIEKVAVAAKEGLEAQEAAEKVFGDLK